jgi:hypothetical protein
MKPIQEYTDAELLTIIRQAENTNVPGSLYQRANNEWQIRHQQKLIDATKNGRGGISFEVGGDMINDGFIQTDAGAKVDIAVAGNYTSRKGKIIQGNKDNSTKQWWRRPEIILPGLALIVAIISIPWWPQWFGHDSNPTPPITPTSAISRGADFLSVKMDAQSKILSIINQNPSTIEVNIYDVAFDVGDITVDQFNHELFPNSLGPHTTFSTLGFGTTSIAIMPNQEKILDTNTFPLVQYEIWDEANSNKDYDKFYCFFISARNKIGLTSFFPVITGIIRFPAGAGLDDPRPTGSSEGGGYEDISANQNLENQIETACEKLYLESGS